MGSTTLGTFDRVEEILEIFQDFAIKPGIHFDNDSLDSLIEDLKGIVKQFMRWRSRRESGIAALQNLVLSTQFQPVKMPLLG